jgi:hypothetical protein
MRYTPTNPELPENPVETQLKKLFDTMAGTTTPPIVIEPEPFYPEETFPGRLAQIHLGSMAVLRALNPANRIERAEKRAQMLERRLDVASFIALRLLQPHITGSEDEKISWIGTHSMADPTDTRKHPGPNWYRPSTRSEIVAERHLERTKDRIRSSRNNAEHLEKSYAHESTSVAWGRDLLKTGARKSGEERKNMRKVSGDIDGHERAAIRREHKFENIANARDLRGKIIRWRLRRANKISSRATPGNEPWKDMRAKRISGRPTPRSEPLVEINVKDLRSKSTPPRVKK